jgi:hypothetical protein
MTKVIASFLLAWAAVAPSNAATPTETEVTFCQFELSEIHQKMSGTFAVIYDFELGKDGRPIGITSAQNDVVEDLSVRGCLATWRIVGAEPGARFRAVFRWEHEVGWVSLEVSGVGFRQILAITGNRCPYRKP